MSTERDPVFGCLLATGRRDREGYAFHGSTRAHIHAWRAAGRDIPTDKELDHLCRRRHCTALHHLELVTRSENELRKSWRYRSRRKLCPAGHALEQHRIITPEGGDQCNLALQCPGGVVCRQCNRDHQGAT